LKLYKEECEKNKRTKDFSDNNYNNSIHSYTIGERFKEISKAKKNVNKKEELKPKNIDINISKINAKNTEFRNEKNINTDYCLKIDNYNKNAKNMDSTAESLDRSSGGLKSPFKVDSEKKINPINITKCKINR